jgi:hypothetical protein
MLALWDQEPVVVGGFRRTVGCDLWRWDSTNGFVNLISRSLIKVLVVVRVESNSVRRHEILPLVGVRKVLCSGRVQFRLENKFGIFETRSPVQSPSSVFMLLATSVPELLRIQGYNLTQPNTDTTRILAAYSG